MNKIHKAVIPAAGLGTRMLPATKAVPKEMLPIVDKPSIQYVVEEAASAGLDDMVFIISGNKTAVKMHFERDTDLEHALLKKHDLKKLDSIQTLNEESKVHYIRQEEPLGLGHAILQAEKYLNDEAFAVMLPDCILYGEDINKKMMDIYKKYDCNVIALMEVPLSETHKYGIVAPKATHDEDVVEIIDMIEKPKSEPPSRLAALGRYILKPNVLEALKKQEEDNGGEIQLTDALKTLAEQGEKIFGIIFHGEKYDIGSRIGWLKANISFAFKNPEMHDDIIKVMSNILREQ